MTESLASTTVEQPEVMRIDPIEIPLQPDDYIRDASSTSDFIQLQHKESGLPWREGSVEELEADIQSRMLSDKELAEVMVEFDNASPVMSLDDSDLEPPEAVELLMCVEEQDVEEIMEEIPQTTFTPATPLPESPALFSTSEIPTEVSHHLTCPQELPLSFRPLTESELTESHNSCGSDFSEIPFDLNESAVIKEAPLKTIKETSRKAKGPSPNPAAISFQPSVLLVGVAALVAVVGIMTFVRSRK